MGKKRITVFTPTYNRAYILEKCYNSLVRQTNKDFLWLIIDDGSTDNTKELVEDWKKENKIEILYVYQENQGMAGAHNTAYEMIDTELNMCVDSDDYLTDNAIEIILNKWEQCDKNNTAGIVALDIYKDGKVVGTKLPENIKHEKLYDLYNKYNVKGDKKLIYRSDLTKKFKYKITKGEKIVSSACKYYQIDQLYDLNILNQPVCVVEYLQDGMSNSVKKSYMKNPNGNIEYAKVILSIPNATKINKFKQAIHYVANANIIKQKKKTIEGKEKIYTIICYPLGMLYSMWIEKEKKKMEKS